MKFFQNWRNVIIVGVTLLLGIAIGAKFFVQHPSTAIYRNKGVLTNSLLGFEVNTKGEFAELNQIENALRELITERNAEGQIKAVSVYFRLLNSGRWFAINPEEKYSPASLLKIPIMMSYYKQAEENPDILKRPLHNSGEFANSEQTTVPEERRLEEGKTYAVEDLVDRMIIDSNNEAMHLLEKDLPKNFISQIYDELQVKNAHQAQGDSMSVADYPFFLRVLYNATYLDEKFSEKSLELLARSSFTEGLPAKLPKDITVAHKFGFRLMENEKESFGELHDCGIIYYPDHPYVLCLMTKGYAREPLFNIIQDLSLLTYKGVDEFFTN